MNVTYLGLSDNMLTISQTFTLNTGYQYTKKIAIFVLQGLVSFDSYIRAPQEGDVEKNMLARYCKVEVAEIVTNISSTKQSWSYNSVYSSVLRF